MPWWVGCTRLHMHSSIASLNWDNTWRWIWERLPWEIKAVLRRAGAPAQNAQISKQVWQVWWLVQPIESRTMTVWRAKKLNCDAFKQNTVNAPVVEAGNQDHRCAKGTRQFIIDRATCVAVSRRRWCGAEGQWLSWTTKPLGGVGSAPCLRQWVKSWFQHSVFLGDTVSNTASMCDWMTTAIWDRMCFEHLRQREINLGLNRHGRRASFELCESWSLCAEICSSDVRAQQQPRPQAPEGHEGTGEVDENMQIQTIWNLFCRGFRSSS